MNIEMEIKLLELKLATTRIEEDRELIRRRINSLYMKLMEG